MSPWPEFDYETARIPMGLNENGDGPVPDEEAVDFMCVNCYAKWPCSQEAHDIRMEALYG